MQRHEKPNNDVAGRLVLSKINHTRHAPKPHFLARPGLSILIDLDRMANTNRQSSLFSINRFNVLSFYERDYGCFHKAAHNDGLKAPTLADYIRNLAYHYGLKETLTQIDLLTFPRIFGVSFNPISVYHGYNDKGELKLLVYEVHNTFGDIHSYVALIEDDKTQNQLHHCQKMMHVSPFFEMDGHYLLSVRQRDDRYSLLIRYDKDKKPALTATLRGSVRPLSSINIVKSLITQRQWPLRPWFAIHLEAIKLFGKKLRFFSRPEPTPKQHSLSSARGVK